MIHQRQAEMAVRLQIQREDVVLGLLEAVEIARELLEGHLDLFEGYHDLHAHEEGDELQYFDVKDIDDAWKGLQE